MFDLLSRIIGAPRAYTIRTVDPSGGPLYIYTHRCAGLSGHIHTRTRKYTIVGFFPRLFFRFVSCFFFLYFVFCFFISFLFCFFILRNGKSRYRSSERGRRGTPCGPGDVQALSPPRLVKSAVGIYRRLIHYTYTCAEHDRPVCFDFYGPTTTNSLSCVHLT